MMFVPGAMFVRQVTLSFAAGVIGAMYYQLSRSATRRVTNTDKILEVGKAECTVTADEDNWTWFDKLVDSELRVALSARSSVLDW